MLLLEKITDGYAGEHYLDENNNVQVRVVSVRKGEQKPLEHIRIYSWDGFEWGYTGAGPNDLAFSILYHAVSYKFAQLHFLEFRQRFINRLDYARWEIDLVDISEWVASISEP